MSNISDREVTSYDLSTEYQLPADDTQTQCCGSKQGENSKYSSEYHSLFGKYFQNGSQKLQNQNYDPKKHFASGNGGLVRANSLSLPPKLSSQCKPFYHQIGLHRRAKTEGCTTQVKCSCRDKETVAKLREPRSLYGAAADHFALHPARWPTEMQVISKNVQHNRSVPSYSEPFCKNYSTDNQQTCNEKGSCEIIFSYNVDSTGYFLKSCVGGRRVENSDSSISLTSNLESSLLFESRFESGNLEKATRVSERAYQLYLRSDLYTKKHNQWYYFMVQNTRAGVRYKFSIMNLHKPHSLYNMGMKPLFYSEIDAFKHNIGWTRIGSDITYAKAVNSDSDDDTGSSYILTFYCEFPHDNDTVYFAHCYPYTYSMLQQYLQKLQSQAFQSSVCKQRVLCRSLAGNYVYILTVTAPGTSFDHSKKKIVIITARVHSGETNSSYILEGIVDYITRDCPKAELLRQQFVFKIVPMLNPDGVIVGNSRCSLSGRDLNRCYRTASKESFPSVWYTKQLVRRLIADHNVIMYCDLHGHSRKQNVFIYGCENKKLAKRHHEQLFPLMFQNTAPDHFSFGSCQFKVQKCKEGTGRVVIWQMGMANSFTIEASLCGSSVGKKAGFHFNTTDFRNIGEHFCQTLFAYCSCDRTNIKGKAAFKAASTPMQRCSEKPP